jgi:Flp pilus assembly protein TadB
LAKLLLIPIAIVAFIIFLIVLGAIGLGVSFIILATLGKTWRLISGAGRRVSRRGRRQQT